MNIPQKNKIEDTVSRLENESSVLYNSFMNAPAGIAILKGDTHVYEFANSNYEKLAGKKITIGKTVQELFPEIEQQGIIAILNNVFSTGEPFIANELPVEINTKGDGILIKFFLNVVVQPLKDENGNIDRLLAHNVDVTEQVDARNKIEASEKRFSNILSQSLMAIAIFTGPEMVVTFANEPMLNVLGKGNDVLNKPLTEGVPELKDQVFPKLLADVYTSGVPFEGFETKAILVRNGIPVDAYFNFVYQPYRDVDDTIAGITVLATEVTEHVLAKKQITESELFNRTILESSPDCLKVLDSEGRIQFMNFNGLCQMEIDDFSTFKNTDWCTLWGSENETLVKASIEKALTGETAQFTALCPTAKGTPKWWDVVVSPVGNAGEPVQRIISVSRDITEKKKSEEAMDKMVSHLKLATDSANVGTWSLNIQTQKLEWSALHKKMWGYDEHRTDLEYEDWHKLILPGDKEKAFEKIEEAKVNHTVYEAQYYINRANDGVLRYMRSFGRYYYNDKGEAETLTGISIDITEQKEAEEQIRLSEERFRTFANSIQNLAWIANGDGWIYWYNQQWYDYTGTTLEEMEGWGWEKVHHPDHIKKVIEFVKEAWKKDEAFELTFPLRRHDGEYRWFLTRAYPVKDATGNIEQWIGTNTDITEQKYFAEELETKVKERTEELETKNLELENTNAQLASFSYIASHDLKEPLRKIQAFSRRIIETENFSDKALDYFNRIISAGERMQNLIDSLLDFSSVDSTDLIFEPCDLNALVEESKNDLHISISEKEAIIEHENLPVIMGVYIQISQLITNLLDNAIKYSRPGIKPLIKITSSMIEGKIIDHTSANNQKKYHAIKFADNGIGFEQEYANKIFELFQRLHLKNEYSGTGIGLGIVKKIVTNHNGFIIVKGKPNIGSTFTIYIPAS